MNDQPRRTPLCKEQSLENGHDGRPRDGKQSTRLVNSEGLEIDDVIRIMRQTPPPPERQEAKERRKRKAG